jgi:hypothetical protein
LFGADADLPIGAARIALMRGAAVVVGTIDVHHRAILVRRVQTSDLLDGGPTRGKSPAAEAGSFAALRNLRDRRGRAFELMGRIVAELEGRIEAAPECWLGLFVPPVVSLRTPRDSR